MTRTRIAIGTAFLAGLLAIPLLVQQQALAAARAEHSQLSATLQVRPAQTVSVTRGAPDAAGHAAQDQADLERLRREAAAVRARLAEFSAQVEQLAASMPWHKPGGNVLGETIMHSAARDVGQATPAAAMQSFMWAYTHGDSNRLLQLAVTEPGADVQQFQEKLLKLWISSDSYFDDYPYERLLEDQPAENDNDRWVVTETWGFLVPDPVNRVLLRPTASGWSCVFDANGSRVTEPIPEPPLTSAASP